MKRIISSLLALVMVLSLLAGLGITVSAAEGEGVAFDATLPEAGGTVSTALTGIPDGFVLDGFSIQKYDYASDCFREYNEATYADDSVYLLHISIRAEDGQYFPFEEEDALFDATIGGVTVDNWDVVDRNENGFTHLAFQKVFVLGNINVLNGVTVESLPAEEAGTSTAATEVKLPEGAPYKIEEVAWYVEEPWERYEGAALAENTRYALYLYLLPQEGFWFGTDMDMAAPMPVDSFYTKFDEGYFSMTFIYDTTPGVDAVEITGIPEAKYGEAISAAGITAPAGAAYTIDASWQIWDHEFGWVEATGNFGFGEYILRIIVDAPGGYTIDNDVAITIDGEDAFASDNWDIWGEGESQLVMEKYIEILPQNGYIENIFIKGAPSGIRANGEISTPALTLSRTDNLTISDVRWLDEEKNPASGKFVDGKVYYLAFTLKPDEGYGLRNGYYAEVEQEDDGYYHPYQAVNEDGTATAYVRYSLLKQLDKIEITYTEPAVGKAPAEPKVPEGVKYAISDYGWHEETSDEAVTVFEDGKVYYLEVHFELAEGYEVADEPTFLVNGKEAYEYSYEETTANIFQRVSFKKQIDRVDITLPKPALGGEADVNDVQVPDGVKYVLWDAAWDSYDTQFNGVFEKDKYRLQLMLTVEDGFEFTEEVDVYINGEKFSIEYAYDSRRCIDVVYGVSFRDKITKVEVLELPVAKVGQTATTPTLEAPAGARYTLSGMWMKYDGNMSGETFTGTFEDKTVYYLAVIAIPDPGCEFSEDVEIIFEGKAFTGVKMVDDSYMECLKLNNLGVPEIQKVDLKTEAPEIGKAPGKLTVSQDANYEIVQQYWSVGDTDDLDDAESMKKKAVFEEGKYYWIAGVLQAKEGYVFADDLQITINGKPSDASFMEELFGFSHFGSIAFYAYGFDKLEAPIPEQKPEAGNPATGDAGILLPAAIAVLSMATLAVTVIGKKEYDI